MSGQSADPPLLLRLADHLTRPADGASQARAGLHLMDWIGCAVAGAGGPAGRVLRQAGMDEVFAWGGLGNILEMDDVDKRALLHPGPTIIPAALVTAEAEEASGEALLAAIVHGYEATVRLGRAVGPAHYAFWHNTGTCGPIGAAAACASLMALDREQAAHAMALAMSQAAGLWQTRHEPASMGKQLHTAHAARAGLDAARLAGAGMTGPLTVLEGEQGFFAAMCKDADPEGVMAGYDSGWLIHEVSFKPWPACRHAHAAIDAALDLRERLDGEALPARLTVRTYGDALTFCDRPDPRTVIEAKFSLQHAVAVTLLRGAPDLVDFEPAAIADPEIAAVRRRVVVETAEPYASAYPARFGAEIVAGDITLAVPDALGDPENPVSEAQLMAKARRLMQAGDLREDVGDALLVSVAQIEAAASARPLVALVREALG